MKNEKVSLSLDSWTSSNGHAFLAVVMHYINDDWKLGKSYISLKTFFLTASYRGTLNRLSRTQWGPLW